MENFDYKHDKQTKKPSSMKEVGTNFVHERKKFATQMDAELLQRLRAYAKSEGRQIQSVLEDAVLSYLKDRQGYVMRPDVKEAHDYILKKYAKTFEALAK